MHSTQRLTDAVTDRAVLQSADVLADYVTSNLFLMCNIASGTSQTQTLPTCWGGQSAPSVAYALCCMSYLSTTPLGYRYAYLMVSGTKSFSMLPYD